MIPAAVATLRGRRDIGDESQGPLPVAKIVPQGATVGLISGLVGAGGDSCWCPPWFPLAVSPCQWRWGPPWW